MQALKRAGWDVVRAIDLYPEKTEDEVLFARAVANDRVFVTNDRPAEAIAIRWLEEGRRFRGMVAWPQEDYDTRSIGDLRAKPGFRVRGGERGWSHPSDGIGSIRRLTDEIRRGHRHVHPYGLQSVLHLSSRVSCGTSPRPMLAVFVGQGEDALRLISARRATRHERRRHEEGK